MSEHAPHPVVDEHASHGAHDAAGHGDAHPHVNYWAIFGALCALTAVSWIADELKGALGKGDMATALVALVVLTVASFKAMFVMLYFMHLKFEGKWKFVLLAPTMILALAIIAALMPDIGSHYYDVQVPQLKQTAHGGHGGGHAAEGSHDAEKPHH